MDGQDSNTRLNQINTLWTLVRRAHDEPGQQANQARAALLERYLGAIRRYLGGAVRDAEAAEELTQEFAYRFLHGDLRGVDPERGRFRDYVKGVLFHLVVDYHKKRRQQPALISDNLSEPGAECSLAAAREEAFRNSWRDELMARAWEALRHQEQAGGTPLYTVLKFRADHPDVPSHLMADRLTVPLGKAITAANVRKVLERARARYADLLLDEIAQGLDRPTRARLEEELVDLGLLEHCREAVERWGPGEVAGP